MAVSHEMPSRRAAVDEVLNDRSIDVLPRFSSPLSSDQRNEPPVF